MVATSLLSMHRYLLLHAVLVIVLHASCSKKPGMDIIYANDNRLNWMGRTFSNEDGITYLVGSSSSLRFRFYGDKCRVWMMNAAPPGEYNYISWTIDGIHHKRISVRSDQPIPLEIESQSPVEIHDVEIYKETEPSCGLVAISKIEAKAFDSIPFQKKPGIEFVGNSITAGMSSDPTLIPCGTNKWYDQSNAYESYGALVARTLGYDYMITAVSGIGVYRNFNSDYPVMSDIYESTFLTPHPEDPKWDFKKFNADVVCINLGTNDLSDGGGVTPRAAFDSSQFVIRYVELIRKIHQHHDQARILLLGHSMAGDEYKTLMEQCLTSVKHKAESAIEGVNPIVIFHFSSFIAGGCDGHPGVEDHKRMAGELEPVIKRLRVGHFDSIR